jgi:hypothetical protein
MKFVAATIFFFITFMCFMVYMVGMHGHLMFRRHMTEDWIIWGIAATSFLFGVMFLVQAVKKRTHNKQLGKSRAERT